MHARKGQVAAIGETLGARLQWRQTVLSPPKVTFCPLVSNQRVSRFAVAPSRLKLKGSGLRLKMTICEIENPRQPFMWSLRSSLLDLQSQLLDLKSESERLEVRLRGFRSKTFGDSEEGSVNDMTSTESEMESLASGTRSEVHSGAASSVSCQKPLSTLRSESFRHLLERQVEFGFVRRDESYITSIFQRYANPFPDGSLKILKERPA